MDQLVSHNDVDVDSLDDMGVGGPGVTPLLACAFRSDNDAVLFAEILLRHGASVEKGSAISSPVMIAAQQGKPGLLQVLLNHGADPTRPATGSPTTPICIAAQNGHAEVVALLARAILAQHGDATAATLAAIDATNRDGKTPARLAVEHGETECVGALVRAGADLRRASPMHYSLRTPTPDNDANVSHFHTDLSTEGNEGGQLGMCSAVDRAVRSRATRSCAECGVAKYDPALKAVQKVMSCGGCGIAYFCGKECQTKGWNAHKQCCKGLREGGDRVKPPVDPAAPAAKAPKIKGRTKEVVGFAEPFGPLDMLYHGHPDNYDRATHPVWEHDEGASGRPRWTRYPARIEAAIESLRTMGSPRAMYRPGKPDNDGFEEIGDMSPTPPPLVSTCYVMFAEMIEREVYTGATRAVRRNGSRVPEVADW